MSVMNFSLIKDPLMKFVQGKKDFRQTTKIIATNYASKQLKHKNSFINLNGLIARLTGRRICNEVLLLKGNTLSYAKIEKNNNLGKYLEKTIELANFSKNLNIPFIYVAAPYKVSTSKDNIPKGTADFANENMDIFLKGLSDANVDSLDLRPFLSSNSKQVNKYFYRTDHHWNPDGAFVALQNIMSKIEMLHFEKNKGEFDKKFTNSKLWKRHEKKEWFLGSHGKRVGKWFAGTDSLIYYTPRFLTKMSLAVPYHRQIRECDFYKGGFVDTNIRNIYIQNKDYFEHNAYCVYIGGDYPIVHHRNVNAPNKMKVLVIKDSFVLPLQAFMSTEFSELDVIDPRHYKASTIAEYIYWTKPDLVLMVNSTAMVGKFGLNNLIADNMNPYQKKEILLKDYNALLVASKSNNKFMELPVSLHAGKTYAFSFKDVIITHGKTDGISIELYDFKKKKVIQRELFDVEFCNMDNKSSEWIFKVPEENSKYLLLAYAGVCGKTRDVGIEYRGINVSLLN
jgi:hypothetical protein